MYSSRLRGIFTWRIEPRAKTVILVIVNFFGSRAFLTITLLWFVLQAIYMAMSTRFGIPPDETHHYDLIRLFAENGWLPFLSNQEGFYHLGAVSSSPFILYHYILSIPYHLISSIENNFVILRMSGVLLGTFSLLTVRKIGDQLQIPKPAVNLSVFMLANTMMFVFISASINYDNLFILLSLLSVSLLLGLVSKFNVRKMLLLICVMLAGLLTKISFLPISLVVGIFLLIVIYKNKLAAKNTLRNLKREYRKNPFSNSVIILIILLIGMVFSYRYVDNVVRYGDYRPDCLQVLTLQQCEQNGIFTREQLFESTSRPKATKNTYQYFTDWIGLMSSRTYGIFGHKSAEATGVVIAWLPFFILLGLIAISRMYSLKDRRMTIVFTIAVFYALVLLSRNYNSYHTRGIFSLAVQGRYLLPVLPLLYLASNYYIVRLLKSTYLQSLYYVITFVIFITAALPSYIYTTTPEWHRSSMSSINAKTKTKLVKLFN